MCRNRFLYLFTTVGKLTNPATQLPSDFQSLNICNDFASFSFFPRRNDRNDIDPCQTMEPGKHRHYIETILLNCASYGISTGERIQVFFNHTVTLLQSSQLIIAYTSINFSPNGIKNIENSLFSCIFSKSAN